MAGLNPWRAGGGGDTQFNGLLKVWRNTYGTHDDAVAAAVMANYGDYENDVMVGGDPVNGNPPSRDSVALFSANIARRPHALGDEQVPGTVVTVGPDWVECNDWDVQPGLGLVNAKVGSVVDVVSEVFGLHSGYLDRVDGNRVYVEEWRPSAPPSAIWARVDPVTKIWGANILAQKYDPLTEANVTLFGLEIGLLSQFDESLEAANNQHPATGLLIVNQSPNPGAGQDPMETGIHVRNKWRHGIHVTGATQAGLIITDTDGVGGPVAAVWDKGSNGDVSFLAERAAEGVAFSLKRSGQAQTLWHINHSGVMELGDGVNPKDVSLARGGARSWAMIGQLVNNRGYVVDNGADAPDLTNAFEDHETESVISFLARRVGGTGVFAQLKLVGEAFERMTIDEDGRHRWGSGAVGWDVWLKRRAAGALHTNGKMEAAAGFGIGNSTLAAGPVGNVVRRFQVYDDAGNAIGYVPIYDIVTP